MKLAKLKIKALYEIHLQTTKDGILCISVMNA